MKTDKSSIRRILIRCPNWVGDVVMATPAFACIRASFPKAKITALIRSYARGVIEDGPWFDSIVSHGDRTLSGFFKSVGHIRREKPDLAILFPNSIRSLAAVWLGGAKKIYGYRRNMRGLVLSGGPSPALEGGKIIPLPMCEYYLEICRSLGLTIPENPKPRLFISEKIEAEGKDFFLKKGISPDETVIGLNPGAKFGTSKCWPPEYFAELANLIEKKIKCRLMLFAGPGEDEIAAAIMRKTSARIINTAPDRVNLALLKPLIKRCSLLVTNDTGPRHYAVALDVPTVVIMGPTDPRYTASNLDKTAVVREDLPCSPCHEKICRSDHLCMRNITPEKVLKASLELMKKGR